MGDKMRKCKHPTIYAIAQMSWGENKYNYCKKCGEENIMIKNKKCKKCGVTHDQKFDLNKLKRKADIVNNMKDKKIEKILQNFRYTLEFNAIDMGDMMGKETVFITNDSEELIDWLRQTLLDFQQEVKEEVREEARKETIRMMMSRIDSKGFYDFINNK